ncbi:MAG: hypothetical protein DWQ49_08920 [Bacteroidetes bacterium]|nr:MAG: hypothetical protein DWQ49_08920 [Bacteroidota bacterium]
MADRDNRSEEEVAQPSGSDIEVANLDQESPAGDTSSDKQAELSRQAQQMGESRKRMAESLLNMAAAGSEEAKAQLLTLTKDERERAYFEKKFGERFTSMLTPKAEAAAAGTAVDPVLQEKVNLLVQDREATRKAQMTRVKEGLGLSLEKGDQFDDLVRVFEGKIVGGAPISFEAAVDMARRQLVPSSPSASALMRGDVAKRPEDSQESIEIPISEEVMRRHARHTGSTSKKDYEGIVRAVNKDGVFRPAL